jgi:hypothetical protein
MSNNPDKNAEGGKFTSKVKQSHGRVLIVEYYEAGTISSWKV